MNPPCREKHANPCTFFRIDRRFSTGFMQADDFSYQNSNPFHTYVSCSEIRRASVFALHARFRACLPSQGEIVVMFSLVLCFLVTWNFWSLDSRDFSPCGRTVSPQIPVDIRHIKFYSSLRAIKVCFCGYIRPDMVLMLAGNFLPRIFFSRV